VVVKVINKTGERPKAKGEKSAFAFGLLP
jgi:hypothetical protein